MKYQKSHSFAALITRSISDTSPTRVKNLYARAISYTYCPVQVTILYSLTTSRIIKYVYMYGCGLLCMHSEKTVPEEEYYIFLLHTMAVRN